MRVHAHGIAREAGMGVGAYEPVEAKLDCCPGAVVDNL